MQTDWMIRILKEIERRNERGLLNEQVVVHPSVMLELCAETTEAGTCIRIGCEHEPKFFLFGVPIREDVSCVGFRIEPSAI